MKTKAEIEAELERLEKIRDSSLYPTGSPTFLYLAHRIDAFKWVLEASDGA